MAEYNNLTDTLTKVNAAFITDTLGASIVDTFRSSSTPQIIEDAETKSILTNHKGNLRLSLYNFGIKQRERDILPEIKDVKIKNKTAVVVYFGDGTQERASVKGDDKFSFEQGITICLLKKMLYDKACGDKFVTGSSIYGKLIKHCMKVYNRNRKAEFRAEEKKREEKERAKRKKQKNIEKKQRREERQIEIQKEAYLRALREFNNAAE